jgi:hypothetical protein
MWQWEPSSSRFWSSEKFWRGSRPCGGAHRPAGWGPEALAPPVTMDRAAARRHGGVLCWARPLASGVKEQGKAEYPEVLAGAGAVAQGGPRSSRRRRSAYGAASRKEKL